MGSLLPFLLFAFVASITPGPTNILVLSHSSRRGLGATLPIIFGACVAATLIVFAVGLGVGETLLQFPRVQQAMAWAGVLWLSWLAWQIFQSSPPSLDPTTPREEGLSVFGVGSARAFGSPRAFKRMNSALAFFLLMSAWLTVLV